MRLIFRIILGAVFCAGSISKLFSMESFELYIFSFGLFSFDLCAVAARILCACELLLGVALATGYWRRCVNWLSAAILAAFTGFLLWRAFSGDEESCHCFGELVDLNPVQSLVKNGVCAVLLALGWTAPGPWWEKLSSENRFFKAFFSRRGRLLTSILSGLLVFVMIFTFCPPDAWFKLIGHTSSDLVVEKWEPYCGEFGCNEGRHIVLFASPTCPYCAKCVEKFSAMVQRDDIPLDRVLAVFMDITDDPADTPPAVEAFLGEHARGLDYDYRSIPFTEFIPMTNGSIPLVCLFEDGRLVKEFDLFSLDETEVSDFLR